MIRVEIIRKASVSGRVGEEDLLKLVFGLRDIEVATFRTVTISRGTVDVEVVARRIGRDRTTAQRSLCNLVSAGLVLRNVKPHRRLYYTYEAVPEERIKEAIREYLRNLHKQLSQSVEDSF